MHEIITPSGPIVVRPLTVGQALDHGPALAKAFAELGKNGGEQDLVALATQHLLPVIEASCVWPAGITLRELDLGTGAAVIDAWIGEQLSPNVAGPIRNLLGNLPGRIGQVSLAGGIGPERGSSTPSPTSARPGTSALESLPGGWRSWPRRCWRMLAGGGGGVPS